MEKTENGRCIVCQVMLESFDSKSLRAQRLGPGGSWCKGCMDTAEAEAELAELTGAAETAEQAEAEALGE